MSFVALLVSLLVAVAVSRRRVDRRGASGWLRAAAPYVGIVLAAPGVIALWYFHRPQPPPREEALFRGVTYARDVRTSPRPIVAHVVRIDLRDPAVSFVTTPRDHGGAAFGGATTSQFLLRAGAQVAINGDFFLPWWSDGPDDFYPHVGQPVDALGASVLNGVVHGWGMVPYSALVVGPDRSVSIVEISERGQRLPPAIQAVSGKPIIVDGGAPTRAATANAAARTLHPRSAVALDRPGTTLLLFAVDGRQPGYSEGVSLAELAAIVVDHGGHRALNLDGGGSTALVIDDGEGGARPLNVPIHTRIPWRQRPVANHLGVLAAPR